MNTTFFPPTIEYFPNHSKIRAVAEFFIDFNNFSQIYNFMRNLKLFSEIYETKITSTDYLDINTYSKYDCKDYFFDYNIKDLDGNLKDQILFSKLDDFYSYSLTLDFSQKVKNQKDIRIFNGKFVGSCIRLLDININESIEYLVLFEFAKENFSDNLF